MRRDQFEYINQYYGLNLTPNCAVQETRTGKRGQVAKADRQYIHIRWDGAARVDGPYHPLDGLIYPPPQAATEENK